MKKKKKNVLPALVSMLVVNPYWAGIDISDKEHVVAVARKKPNAASKAFKFAANALQRSGHYLGDYFRRMKAKGGNKYAIVATANKLARIYYKMLTEKVEFKPMELSVYHHQYQTKKFLTSNGN